MEGTPEAKLLDEFHQHRLGEEFEDMQFAEAETAFFDDVVKGVIARYAEIDTLIEARLADNWKFERLDRTMQQVLRAGCYELLARADVPTNTVITEYVDVAHAFFEKPEAKFVNGILDAVAKAVR